MTPILTVVATLKVGRLDYTQPISMLKELINSGRYNSIYIDSGFSEVNLPLGFDDIANPDGINLIASSSQPILWVTSEQILDCVHGLRQNLVGPIRLLQIESESPYGASGQLLTFWNDAKGVTWQLSLLRTHFDHRLRLEPSQPSETWFANKSFLATSSGGQRLLS